MKKGLVYAVIGLGLGVGGYATFLIFRKLSNARVDSKTVTLEEALVELEKSR